MTRDFEADVFDASETPFQRRQTDFSWTPAREKVFRRCRREYFLRYILAQGAWNSNAHPAAREAYLEKHLPSFSAWLDTTFEASFAEALRAGAVRARLPRILAEKTMRLVNSLSEKRYLEDPKYGGISEFHFREKGFEDPIGIAARATRVFAAACAFEDLEKIVGKSDLRKHDDFVSFHISTIRVWFRPGVFHMRRGSACVQRFRLAEDGISFNVFPADAAMDAALLRMWLVSRGMAFAEMPFEYNILAVAPDSCAMFFTPPEMETPATVVENGSASMLKDTFSGKALLSDFPKNISDHCAVCRFRGSCAKI